MSTPGRVQPYGYGGGGGNLADILERVLDKGVVVAGDIRINLLDIELLTIKLRLLIASVDKARELGIDWWEHDPSLSSRARAPLGARPDGASSGVRPSAPAGTSEPSSLDEAAHPASLDRVPDPSSGARPSDPAALAEENRRLRAELAALRERREPAHPRPESAQSAQQAPAAERENPDERAHFAEPGHRVRVEQQKEVE